MDSHDLTPEQLHALTERLVATLGYLSRLQARMEHEGFPPRDRLFRATCEAQASMQALVCELRALSCPGVMGRRG